MAGQVLKILKCSRVQWTITPPPVSDDIELCFYSDIITKFIPENNFHTGTPIIVTRQHFNGLPLLISNNQHSSRQNDHVADSSVPTWTSVVSFCMKTIGFIKTPLNTSGRRSHWTLPSSQRQKICSEISRFLPNFGKLASLSSCCSYTLLLAAILNTYSTWDCFQ